MRPIVFNECFGWLHDAEGETGVVLCNPYGHEALWTHRGWRALAAELARHQIPALRFDYRGTGDSAGNENEGDAIETWLNSIEDAVRYMRENTNVTRIVLCGVRLGGTLAALVASRIAVDGLIMMAPITSGREYLRELRIIQRRWRNTAAAHIEADSLKPDYVESLGFRLYPDSLRHLERVALPQDLQPSVSNVLLLDPEKSRDSSALAAFYREHEINVEVDAFDDFTSLLSETGNCVAPLAAIQRVVSWVKTHLPEKAPHGVLSARSMGLESAADIASNGLSAAPMLCGEGFRETPVIFDDGRLFGIYCSPASVLMDMVQSDATGVDELLHSLQIDRSSVETGKYAVLFTNTAVIHHVGEARMWVTQARLLAQHGIASLRMDIAALGDSGSAQDPVNASTLHGMRSCADVSEGIDWLVEAGHTRPSSVGICSGAYLCFRATAMNPRAAGAVLINQSFYSWSGTERVVPKLFVASTRVYLASIRRADKWKRLFSGQIPVATIANTLARRHLTKWRGRIIDLLSKLRGQDGHISAIRKEFRLMAQRGVNVSILYGDFDVGLEEAQTIFGRDFDWFRRLPNTCTAIERSLDHALFLYPARDVMTRVIKDHLRDAGLRLAEQVGGNAYPLSRLPVESVRPTAADAKYHTGETLA